MGICPGAWFGESATNEPLHEWARTLRRLIPRGCPIAERAIDESLFRALDLPLGQRPERHDFDPAGKRLGERGQHHDVRRAGEQEAPGRTVAIDRGLDGAEEPGCALHLVEHDRPGERVDEATGVARRRGQFRAVVERCVGTRPPSAGHRPREGRLADLPRAMQQHDGGVPEGLLKLLLGTARVHGPRGYRHLVENPPDGGGISTRSR